MAREPIPRDESALGSFLLRFDRIDSTNECAAGYWVITKSLTWEESSLKNPVDFCLVVHDTFSSLCTNQINNDLTRWRSFRAGRFDSVSGNGGYASAAGEGVQPCAAEMFGTIAKAITCAAGRYCRRRTYLQSNRGRWCSCEEGRYVQVVPRRRHGCGIGGYLWGREWQLLRWRWWSTRTLPDRDGMGWGCCSHWEWMAQLRRDYQHACSGRYCQWGRVAVVELPLRPPRAGSTHLALHRSKIYEQACSGYCSWAWWRQ